MAPHHPRGAAAQDLEPRPSGSVGAAVPEALARVPRTRTPRGHQGAGTGCGPVPFSFFITLILKHDRPAFLFTSSLTRVSRVILLPTLRKPSCCIPQWAAQKDEIATLRAQLEKMKQMYSEVGKKAGALPEVMGKFSELQSYAKSLKAEYERRIGEVSVDSVWLHIILGEGLFAWCA